MIVRTFIFVCFLIEVACGSAISVRGKITCHGYGISNARITLFDHFSFVPDTDLEEQVTDEDGNYFMTASLSVISSMGTMNPYMEIHHKCLSPGAEHCQRYWFGRDATRRSDMPQNVLVINIELTDIEFSPC